MSIPGVMRKCLQAAGVEFGAAPVSSSLEVRPDGFIGLYLTFEPSPPRRQDNRSAGMRQSGVVAAGHKDNCSAGKRQSGVVAAGQSQSLSSSAGSQPHFVPGVMSAGKPQSTQGEPRVAHSKSRCPSQRRRSAR